MFENIPKIHINNYHEIYLSFLCAYNILKIIQRYLQKLDKNITVNGTYGKNSILRIVRNVRKYNIQDS